MGLWHDKLNKTGKRLLICSGGQRGADSGGLAAAHDLGLPTGGYAPKGWKTLNGMNMKLSLLGLIEHKSDKYPPRTYDNVKLSDGTIRLANDFNSPGELCTLKAIEYYNKPHLDINLNDKPFLFDVIDWIENNNIKVLNIAGNAGKTKEESIIIFNDVRQYLKSIFQNFIPEKINSNEKKT